MRGVLDIPSDLAELGASLPPFLAAVEHCFTAALASDAPAVRDLTAHVARYRGKMLRPTLVFLAGLAAHPRAPRATHADLSPHHTTIAAVVEMVHMATLVHDDVLDSADLRRRAPTINHLHGNEAAVLLGDLLFSAAYALAASLPTPGPARAVAAAGKTLCEGELIQLSSRGNLALSPRDYETIIDRKTASLIAVSARLGAEASNAAPHAADALERFARLVGQAFQVQDDLLDLAGDPARTGKPVGQDAALGKLTLPLIHHLAAADAHTRAGSLATLAAMRDADPAAPEHAASLRAACLATGSVDFARAHAQALVDEGLASLADVPASPARRMLEVMARAVVDRDL